MFRIRTLIVAAAVVAGVLAPATTGNAIQANLSGNPSAMWQTNGTVWTLHYANGVVYAGGDFTSVRPPGSALGQNEVPRGHLAAFDSTTGDLLPLDVSFDARVRALDTSPDGQILYVGGDFRTANGLVRNRLAAIDLNTGALIAKFRPSANAPVYSLAANQAGVFAGGAFTTMSTVARQRLAEISSDGSLLPWNPTANKVVWAMALTTDGARLIVGGSFDTLNNQAGHAVGALDPDSGATLPWAANVVPANSNVHDIDATPDAIYFGADGVGIGIFDGTFATTPSGTLLWKDNCLGATQSVEYMDGFLYTGSHAHDCAMVPGGFPQFGFNTGKNRHLQAEYASDGHLAGGWFANTDAPNVGPRAMASDGQQLFVGGDFKKVNDSPQQGLTRFARTPDAKPNTPKTPVVTSTAAGAASISWPGVIDRDDATLTYLVYRVGVSAPIGSVTANTYPWTGPILRFRDSGLTPGSAQTYRIAATDGVLTSPKSPTSVPVTISATDPPQNYSTAVLADSPRLYWKFDDSGSTAADASGNGNGGIYAGGTSQGIQGAVPSEATGAAAGFNGSTAIVSSSTQFNNPTTYSLELWFRTTTIYGGKIVGFGSSQLGTSTSYDRHVFMMASGQLQYGIYSSGARMIRSPASYNDGSWHYLVATQSSQGMRLYVDGALVASGTYTTPQNYKGYWRLGGDNLNGWADSEQYAAPAPPSYFLKGDIDEFAYYDRALTASDILRHYNANQLNH